MFLFFENKSFCSFSVLGTANLYLKNSTMTSKFYHANLLFLGSYFNSWKSYSFKTHNMHPSIEFELYIFKRTYFLWVKKFIFVLLLSPAWLILRLLLVVSIYDICTMNVMFNIAKNVLENLFFTATLTLRVFASNQILLLEHL